MISEESRDTEDWNNGRKFSFASHKEIILKNIFK